MADEVKARSRLWHDEGGGEGAGGIGDKNRGNGSTVEADTDVPLFGQEANAGDLNRRPWPPNMGTNGQKRHNA